MKKIVCLLLALVMTLSVSVVAVSAQETEISDDFLNAVRLEYNNEKIQKDDIYLYFMELISQDNYLVKYSVNGYGYTCDIVDIKVGAYVLNTARPTPVVYTNGVVYEIADAYEQGVLSDDDLYIMSTFDKINMVKSKITQALQYEMIGHKDDEFINVRFSLDGDENTSDEELHQRLLTEVFAEIEYKDLVHNNGISIVAVKCCDIEKVADFDLVKEMDYISDIHLKYILRYDMPLDEYYYNEIIAKQDETGKNAWVLIEAYNLFARPLESSFRFGDTIISNDSLYSNFSYKFGVYDIYEDQFYDVYDLRDTSDKYQGLESALRQFAKGRPAGDSDGDNSITILDATTIQRYLAQIELLSYDKTHRVSDIDNDGDVTIMDATKIQRKLAKLDK